MLCVSGNQNIPDEHEGQLTNRIFVNLKQMPDVFARDTANIWASGLYSGKPQQNAARSLASGIDTTHSPVECNKSLPGILDSSSPQSLLRQVPTSSSHMRPCFCLRQLVRLIYDLEDLDNSCDNFISIEGLLHGARLAQTPWRQLMSCSDCQYHKDQEVFLLFSMSIRMLLCSVRDLYDRHLGVLQSQPPCSSTSSSSPSASATQCDGRSVEDFDLRFSVGDYELTTEEKSLTLRIIIRNALQSIIVACLYLWKEQGASVNNPADTVRLY